MIKLRTLEFHAVHGCNLTCQQCSHYANFHRGGIVTVEQAAENFNAWRGRIAPRQFAILGGEPTLNPNLCRILALGRYAFPRSRRLLVSNGFFLHRHADLPRFLIDHRYSLEISQHGESPEYLNRFEPVRELLKRWQHDYPGIAITVRPSHRGWMRQYNVDATGRPIPMQSDPQAAFKVCMQKHCTQLFKKCLWKCPALAYFSMTEAKLRLEDIPAWQLFRDYQACPPTATPAEVRTFVETKAIPQCGLCPSNRIPFHHPDPTQRIEQQ